MPLYRRRRITSKPGFWELNEVVIITPDAVQSRHSEQVIRNGIWLIVSLIGTLAARTALPAIKSRLLAETHRPALREPHRLLLPPPSNND